MSEKGIINNALHRPLTGGNSFNKYIPSSTCEKSYLGEGDTFFSMDGIKANILKNYNQTAKLAPQLQKNTLVATTTAIYDFLYNHIQYKADGAAQNLRSPACSWHVRKDGIDCKSFSIFSGAILTSMGYKYFIRKIKQPGMLPDEFTHVYIIVPKDQKTGSLNGGYFVIDATKHQNTEAAFIEKNDVFMGNLKHFGLQAPAIATCQVKGRVEPVSQTAQQGFRDFLSYLQQIGIDNRVLCKIRKTTNFYLDKGVNPEFLPTTEGVVIEGNLIKYAYPVEHGRKIYKSPIAIAVAASKEVNGLNASGGSGSGSGSGTTTEGELGEELGTVVEGMISDSNWWDNTFGAIFGNGWDLSCWGASNNPKKSAGQVQVDATEYFKASGLSDASKGGLTTANLQKWVDVATVYIANRNFGKTNNDLANCTRKGNEVGFEGMKTALGKVIMAAEQILSANGGELKFGPEKTISNYDYAVPSGYLDGHMRTDGRFTVKAPTYIVIAPKPVVIPPNTPGTGGGSGSGNGGNTGSGGGSNPPVVLPGGGSGNGGNTKPAAYYNLSQEEKNIYDRYIQDKNLSYYNTYRSQNPSYKATAALLQLLKLPTTGTQQLPTVTVKPNAPQVQQAGMNPILAIGLIAGGIYMYMQNKKK
jgi:hypothetical protein